jgi:hypothetical protein
MEVMINGRQTTSLPANWERDIRLGAERPEVEGRVLGPEAAAAKFLFRYRIICACVMVFIWLFLGVMFALGQPQDQLRFGPFFLALAVVTPLLLVVAYLVRRSRLYASLPQRSRVAPPPGTEIRVDGSGLTIGGRFATWREVEIDRVNFEFFTGRHGGRIYLVHQLDVRSKDFSFRLDGVLISEGSAIVAEIWRRKYPP